ncbi:hypothetical protein GUJ93_ZPchr0006g46176 [Zizania palustris]|uniref:Uncharacterized protein n=1 Tax=Zizania palustris TaxID=103762 RepID=A0A8J5T1P5_ZIZPA|nr:hypothetical protein GUJ93_ZPchr0006g46176 [Zizania palustris]
MGGQKMCELQNLEEANRVGRPDQRMPKYLSYLISPRPRQPWSCAPVPFCVRRVWVSVLAPVSRQAAGTKFIQPEKGR